MSKFAFNLNDGVKIIASQEEGIVIARAEYATSEPSYLLRYKCADGRAVEAWWTESALANG
jgi:hypothetical protein